MVYLTVHDLVWINNSVTGKVNTYDYVTLEAAMAGQYRYGDSQDVSAQAATLLQRLLKSLPFEDGNRRTAFIATLTFLNANGYATQASDPDAAAILQAAAQGQTTAEEAIAALAVPADLALRKLISHECNLHIEALKALTAND